MTKQLKSAILKKARFLAAPEMKTIEIGVVGKFYAAATYPYIII